MLWMLKKEKGFSGCLKVVELLAARAFDRKAVCARDFA
jgi:hypothetical protein